MEEKNLNKNGSFVNGKSFRFDDFGLDPSNRILRRGDELVPLTGKVFDLLLVFAENPGRLLEKDELLEKVWHGEFVEEGNLARNVSTLRKALGDNGKEYKYIATVQGRGYRFVPEVSRAKDVGPESAETVGLEATDKERHPSRRWVLAVAVLAIFVTAGWLGTESFLRPSQSIRSLAVLPLKRLDGGDSYLGIGIADSVIRRISQSRQLTVRPTSAIVRYSNTDADSLAAAKDLGTDAVLEGNIQHLDDRLRVNINLLRSADGVSLWADSFDIAAGDVFAVQDDVAKRVASKLLLHLDTNQAAGPRDKYPTNNAAYELYLKGVFSLDERGYGKEALQQMSETIGLFNRAIESDPNYALAHAQLAWAYVWTALFIEPENARWAELARQEITKAEQLDPQIAETHLAKAMFYWSKFENYQNDAALREVVLAQQIDPNTTHGELVGIVAHLGLEEEAERELKKAEEVDPTGRSLKDLDLILPFLRGDADAWLIERQKLPNNSGHLDPWYYLRKGQLEEAKKALDERLEKDPENKVSLMQRSLYLALKGDAVEAESKVLAILATVQLDNQFRHHITYDAACVYAVSGHAPDAVKWLRETAASGFPNYPAFARDPFFDHIRQTPEFVQFIGEQKAQWERFRQEMDQ